MGFKPWRNLGVLALAGVSLVGCTAPQTSKLVVPTPPTQNNSYNVPAGQAPPAPNPNVFGGNQPLVPSANGGFDNQQRSNMQGLPQNGGPANPNQGFNTNGNNPVAPTFPPPSSPTNRSYLTTPDGNLQQQYNNPGLQGNSGNPGGMVPQNPYALQPGGVGPNGMPPLPSAPPTPTGGFTPPTVPSGFGTGH